MSVLAYRWQLEFKNIGISRASNAQYNDDGVTSGEKPVYHKISANSIHKHCLMLPYHKESHFVMEIIDQEL